MPVPTVSAIALVYSSSFPPAARDAGGAQHDAVSLSLEKLAGSAAEKSAKIDATIMPNARGPARLEQGGADFASVVTIAGPRANELIRVLAGAEQRAGMSRKLNAGDLPATTSRVDELQQSNKIELVRSEVARMSADGTAGDALGAIVRDAFNPAADVPREKLDLVTPFAIDSLPPFLLARVEAVGLVKIADLRAKLLARLDTTGAAQSVDTLTYVTRQLAYNIEATVRALGQLWGPYAPKSDALDALIRDMRTALRQADAA